MNIRKILIVIGQLVLLVIVGYWFGRDYFEPYAPKKERVGVSLKQTDGSIFKRGQVWSYKTRPGEEDSRLTVFRTDNSPKFGVIVSVYVEGLKMKDPQKPDEIVTEIHQMAFSESALKNSVVKMDGMASLLPSDANYQEWASAYDLGLGGIIWTSVAEAVDHVETTLSTGKSKWE